MGSIHFTCVILPLIIGFIDKGESASSRCYLCTGSNCGDPFDSFSATVTACNKEFQAARFVDIDDSVYAEAVANSNAVAKENQIMFPSDSALSTTTEDSQVELVGDNSEIESFARIIDIKRKIWEFFYKIGLDDNASYVCVKTNYIENGANRTYRGCVPENHKNIQPCEVVSTALGFKSNTYIIGCYTCGGNLCNSGVSIKQYLPFLVVSVIIKFVC